MTTPATEAPNHTINELIKRASACRSQLLKEGWKPIEVATILGLARYMEEADMTQAYMEDCAKRELKAV